MGIVVMKFGGTSVSTKENREAAIRHIKNEIDNGNSPVAVVSAMGRKGAPYATDTLLSLVPEEADSQTKDLLCSCGETISACVFACDLMENGIKAKPFNATAASIMTDGVFGSAEVESINTENLQKAIAEGIVPVITGFQGITADGYITTLGRGGSDTSAVEIGGFLKADAVDIYTDVPGIAIVDPRIVKSARYVDKISYEDIYRLALFGSSVIHPRAVGAGMKHGVPMLRVRSTFDDLTGTMIVDNTEDSGLVGIAVIKNVSEDPNGSIIMDSRSFSKNPDGEYALISIVYKGDMPPVSGCFDGITAIQMEKDFSQFITSTESVNDTVNRLYDLLA